MGSWNSKRQAIAICLLGLAIGVTSSSALWSCTSLGDIQEDVCGNRVLEAREDCDSYPELRNPDAGDAGDADDAGELSPNACGAKGTPGACRYICTYHGDYPVCPSDAGSQCGLDGICRVPGGISDTPLTVYGVGAERLFSDDFDGDGRIDAVAIGTSSIDIHFFGASGSIDKTVSTPVDAPSLPGIGDVNGDARADLVLNLGASGLGVMLSQEDRTLVTRSYPTRVIPNEVKKLVALGPSQKGGMLLAFLKPFNAQSNTLQLSLLFPTRQTGGASSNVVFAAPNTSFDGEIQGAIGVSGKPLIPAIPCRSVAFFLKKQGGLELNVIRCGNTNDIQDWKQSDLDRTSFPSSKSTAGGAFFADLDKDGDEDLAYDISENGGPSVVYARINDGTQLLPEAPFASASSDACTSSLSNRLFGHPLATGDVNGDGDVDIVDSGGIWFQHGSLKRKCIGGGDGTWGEAGAWKAAAISDFDGNGIADVLAVRADEPVIDFWGGVGGGELNTITISPGFEIEDIVVGDFDGDSISDAILRPRSITDNMGMGSSPDAGADAGAPKGPPELFVMFGKPFSPPDAPVRLGQLDGIPTAIVAGDITGKNAAGDADPLTDLAVITYVPENKQMAGAQRVAQLSIIAGHPYRRLLSPLMLTNSVALDADQASAAKQRQPGQILVSRFHSSYCADFMAINDPTATRTTTPKTIAVLENGGTTIWIAGCGPNGEGLRIPVKDDPANQPDWQFLFPIQRNENTDSLGLFSLVAQGSAPNAAKIYWVQPSANTTFSVLYDNTAGNGTKILLPTSGNVDPFLIPYRFVDINGSEESKGSKADIAFAADTNGSNIVVYWNRSGDALSDIKKTIRQDDTTPIPLPPELYDTAMGGPMGTGDERPFRDFVFINIDSDPEKELVVLTNSGIYSVQTKGADNRGDPAFDKAELLYSTFSGRALLAIDANSDGIDDLMLADERKLLLFLGKEAGR